MSVSQLSSTIERLGTRDLQAISRAMTPKLTKYIPHFPTSKQAALLLLDGDEAFYGGAAGGGKSDALLMGALQYVDIPSYSAILFRKTFADLTLPGALMDRSRDWLHPHGDVRWVDRDKTYRFPSGATLTFGYLEHENDKYRYQSAEFQYIGFDELTQFTESQYRYLFSRLRRLQGVDIPLRMRSASNPGGSGHRWVKQRMIVEGRKRGIVFIPAKLEDNPHLDQKEYEASLSKLDPITREQLRKGNWDIEEEGLMFKRSWFEIVDRVPQINRLVRYWDFAATDPTKTRRRGKGPDWTAGVLLGELDGFYYVLDIVRAQKTPHDVEMLVKQTAARDGRNVSIYIEEEPGSSGKITIDYYSRKVLNGYAVRGNRSTGSKVLRANPLSSAAEAGRVKLLRGAWIGDFLDEVESFPGGENDDQVDALSGGFNKLGTVPILDALPIEIGEGTESYWTACG